MIHCNDCGATRESVALSAAVLGIAQPICCEIEPRPSLVAVSLLDWSRLGDELRSMAQDAFPNDTYPSLEMAYSFMLENPECFGYAAWPDGMPADPGIELAAAYYHVGMEPAA